MDENNEKQSRRVLRGVVTGDRMDKTVVVEVQHRVRHHTYKKYISRRVRYKAHDAKNECHVGDQVLIIESRPMSGDKRWRVQRIVERAR